MGVNTLAFDVNILPMVFNILALDVNLLAMDVNILTMDVNLTDYVKWRRTTTKNESRQQVRPRWSLSWGQPESATDQ